MSLRLARSMRTLCTVGAAASLVAAAQADQILVTHNASLTSYLPGAATGVQDVRPLLAQRGVGLDGTLRMGGAFRWAMAANPFEGEQAGARLGDVRLASGHYAPLDIDIALPAQVPWVIGRTYNAVQETSGGAHRDSDGYQGKNWFQISQPELVFFDNDGMVAKEEEDMLYLVYGADRFLEFRRTADNADTFRGVNGTAGVIELESGSPDVWVYYDQRGVRTYFFGDNTSGDRADWQIWKIVDAAGNVAYVGHETTASTAVTSGYNADATISLAYDSAGRRYCYAYTTLDSVSRLTKVTARTGATTCDNGTVVGQVDYEYYKTGDNTHGDNGNLKLVTINTPLSGGSRSYDRQKYYRYYTAAWSGGAPGHPNTIKLVLGFEGARNYDWNGDTTRNTLEFDQGFEIATDATLKPYAEAFFEYAGASDYRVSAVFFNGECGCGGASSDGEYNLTYEADPNFSDTTTAYDEEWLDRVVIEPPTGGTWATQYFDEAGQPLSRVLTDGNPASGSPDTWVTEVVRNADGQVTEIHTPANVTAYTHDSMGSPDGAITTSGSAGLVWYLERVSSGDGDGLLQARRQAEGDTNLSTNSEYVSWQNYLLRSLNIATGVNVTRPVIDDTRAYHTATTTVGDTAKYDQTTRDHTWWNDATSSNIEYIVLKQVDTNAPAVSASKNGSGSATTTSVYTRKDGTVAFTKSARGIVTSTQLTNGRLTKRIEDADTNTGTTYPTNEHPHTDFGIAQSTAGVHRTTTMTYDAQGRLSETTRPSGRRTQMVYGRIVDHRTTTASIPLVADPGAGDNYYGPATLTGANHSGAPEWCMTLKVTISTADPVTWAEDVVESGTPDADPIKGLENSNVAAARLTTSSYNESGVQLESRTVYHTIGANVGASSGDTWTMTYDDLGRRTKMTDPTGTISKTQYDVLGRVTATFVGTVDGGGSDNMVKVSEMVYDSNNDGGNSHLTKRTSFVENGTNGQRMVDFYHDYRGRLIFTDSPAAPYSVVKFDNLGRMVASALYSSDSGLSAATDPTSVTSNRVALSQTFFDERGQVWKASLSKINQSTGAESDSLLSLSWYDPDGRLIKVNGEQLTKTRYDRLGRPIQSFVLASDNDSTYNADVYDTFNLYAGISGDYVLEETQTGYDADTDRVLVTATISREHDDTSTTGPLDTTYDGGDGDPLDFTASNVKGRIQITAHWYDDQDRPVTTAFYGTNHDTDNAADFDRSSTSEPSASSDERLVTTTTYDDDGSMLETTDAEGRVTRYEYDDAGRTVATIANRTSSPSNLTTEDRDNDLYTRYAYSSGLRTHVWVDQQGNDTGGAAPTTFTGADANDQVTKYTYGTTKGTAGSGTPVESAIATGHLLYQVTYPDTENVTYAYNAQAQQVYIKDQAGNVIETAFDTLGRETDRKATTIDTPDFDDAVKRISMTYTNRGFVEKVTQYDATTGGNVVDDVKYAYDDWGNLDTFEQDVDSEIGGTASGRASFQVDHTYAKSTPSSPNGRNTIRRTQTTIPGGTDVLYTYLSASGRLDDDFSRVSRVSVRITGGLGSTTVDVADYEYLGAGFLVGTDLTEPEARSEYFESAGASDPYPDLDRYNRVTDSRWTGYKNSGTRDFYDVDITYGSADNYAEIIGIQDNVHKTAIGNRNFDVAYTRDALGRLTRAREGTLSITLGVPSITNATRDEQWLTSGAALGLSQTGNWNSHRLDLDGNGAFNDTSDERDATNTFNKVNELTGRDIDGGGDDFNPLYDEVGNLIDDDEDYEFVYDPFGRLRKVVTTGMTDTLVAEYRYNGLGHRIGWHYDTTASGGGGPDGTVDANDPWFYFCYDDNWRMVATFRGSDANPKEVFVHHNAGLGGFGGSSYIDSVILRDRDANTTWHEAADSTREERVYYCQNWRADVSAILTDDGKLLEWIKYSAYGMPISLPAGDTDSDGDWDAADSLNISLGGTDVRRDTTLDGNVTVADSTHANSITGGFQTLGRDTLTSTGVENRRGYAGYEYDPTFNGADRHLYHVRHRVYDAEAGRWTRRDPLGYVDGMGLYAYCQLQSIAYTDPFGLAGCAAGSCGTPSVSMLSGSSGLSGRSGGVPGSCGMRSQQQKKKEPARPKVSCREAEVVNGNCCASIMPCFTDGYKRGINGVVVCCKKKLVACVFERERDKDDKTWDPITVPDRGMPPAPGKPGLEAIYKCVKAHEDRHIDDRFVENPCDHCDEGKVCFPKAKPNDRMRGECDAYKTQLRCLKRFDISWCEQTYKNSPTKRRECHERLAQEIERVKGRCKDFCENDKGCD